MHQNTSYSIQHIRWSIYYSFTKIDGKAYNSLWICLSSNTYLLTDFRKPHISILLEKSTICPIQATLFGSSNSQQIILKPVCKQYREASLHLEWIVYKSENESYIVWVSVLSFYAKVYSKAHLNHCLVPDPCSSCLWKKTDFLGNSATFNHWEVANPLSSSEHEVVQITVKKLLFNT